MRRILNVSCAVMGFALAGCEAVRDASDHAADNSKKVIYDTKERWRDLLTYKPRTTPPQAQGPQTRYCYRMQMDIVCYDAPQIGLTAPLIGYQDGTHFSWYKQGGGSLGFSLPPDAPAAVAENTSKQSPFKPAEPAVVKIAPSPTPGEVSVKQKPAPKKDWVK